MVIAYDVVIPTLKGNINGATRITFSGNIGYTNRENLNMHLKTISVSYWLYNFAYADSSFQIGINLHKIHILMIIERY